MYILLQQLPKNHQTRFWEEIYDYWDYSVIFGNIGLQRYSVISIRSEQELELESTYVKMFREIIALSLKLMRLMDKKKALKWK